MCQCILDFSLLFLLLIPLCCAYSACRTMYTNLFLFSFLMSFSQEYKKIYYTRKQTSVFSQVPLSLFCFALMHYHSLPSGQLFPTLSLTIIHNLIRPCFFWENHSHIPCETFPGFTESMLQLCLYLVILRFI